MLAVELLPELDCSTCTASQQKARGCITDAPTPHELPGGIVTKRCPRRPLLDDPELFSEVFWSHQLFKRGILPEDGGLLNQPGKLVEMWNQIDRARNTADWEREKARKAVEARKAKKVRRSGR